MPAPPGPPRAVTEAAPWICIVSAEALNPPPMPALFEPPVAFTVPPVIVIAPHDRVFEKTVSNMQEVAARGGRIILITDQQGARHTTLKTMETVVLPDVPELIAPIIYALPIQMLAYFTAVFMGTDVDQPRNLAKSVTVE